MKASGTSWTVKYLKWSMIKGKQRFLTLFFIKSTLLAAIIHKQLHKSFGLVRNNIVKQVGTSEWGTWQDEINLLKRKNSSERKLANVNSFIKFHLKKCEKGLRIGYD